MGLGRLIKGTVFDCDKKWLERRLQQYDSQLYIKWNSEKNGGYGIWEVRRRPSQKSKVYKGVYINGSPIFSWEYVENDLECHVIDVNTLTERVIYKIQSMDTFRTDNWVAKFDNEQERSQNRLVENNRKELAYQLRQNRKHLQILKDSVASGYNPAQFFAGFNKSNK